MLAVMLTEPALLRRAFEAEALQLPIEYALPVVLALLAAVVAGCMGLPSLLRQAMRKGRWQAGHDPGDAISAGLGRSCRAANGHADALVLCLFRIACRRLDCLCGHARHLTRSARILTDLDDQTAAISR